MQLFFAEKNRLCNSEPLQHSCYAASRFTYFTAFAPCEKNAWKSSRVYWPNWPNFVHFPSCWMF